MEGMPKKLEGRKYPKGLSEKGLSGCRNNRERGIKIVKAFIICDMLVL